MSLELWIIIGLAVAVVAVGVVRRLRGVAKRDRGKETKNVYPLW